MLVRFQRSGGFTGQLSGCKLDTTKMSDAEAHELERLIAVSGVMDLQDKRATGARDVHIYDLMIEASTGTKHLVIDQISVPAPAKELFSYLVAQSKPMSPVDVD